MSPEERKKDDEKKEKEKKEKVRNPRDPYLPFSIRTVQLTPAGPDGVPGGVVLYVRGFGLPCEW